MPRYYAGIGSRETPTNICNYMTKIAKILAKKGYVLRSGGAAGADSAFERGAGSLKEIWLPAKGFNKNASTLTPSPEAFVMAKKYHPAWGSCNDFARKLHARNCHQIMGSDLKTPVDFVICWTKGGKGQGGTGQALRTAKGEGKGNIPVYDLGDPETLKKMDQILESLLDST